MRNFARRNSVHDMALENTIETFERYGIDAISTGIEEDIPVKEMVQRGRKDDRCSLMLRYRPDLAIEIPSGPTLMCEVKASWFMEARSYWGMAAWDCGRNVVMTVVRDRHDGVMYANWLQRIRIDEILIPDHHRWSASESEAIRRLFPNTPQRQLSGIRGSGAPFIMLSRDDYLPLQSFIEMELRQLPKEMFL